LYNVDSSKFPLTIGGGGGIADIGISITGVLTIADILHFFCYIITNKVLLQDMDALRQQYSQASHHVSLGDSISDRQLTPLPNQALGTPGVFPSGATLSGTNVIWEENVMRSGQIYSERANVPLGLRAAQGLQPTNNTLNDVVYNFK
jgi:hypothetical protein